MKGPGKNPAECRGRRPRRSKSSSPSTSAASLLRANLAVRKQAEEALRRVSSRQELLTETAKRLLVSENPQGMVEELCRKVMDFLDCHVFFNFLADLPGGRLRLNSYAGISAEEARRIEWLDFGVAVCGGNAGAPHRSRKHSRSA